MGDVENGRLHNRKSDTPSLSRKVLQRYDQGTQHKGAVLEEASTDGIHDHESSLGLSSRQWVFQ